MLWPKSWRRTLSVSPEADIPALLRASARHREHYAHRLVANAPTAATLGDALAAWVAGEAAPGTASGEFVSGDLAFVYSGNGSQWAGMGLDAMRTSKPFRVALADVNARPAPELGWSVTACLASDELGERLRYTKVAQPLLFAIQVAVVSALRSLGLRPAAHIGHSAGEGRLPGPAVPLIWTRPATLSSSEVCCRAAAMAKVRWRHWASAGAPPRR